MVNPSVLKINKLPAIQFPSAHPQTDETYVCHPFNKKLYIPISNYEKELLHDRINEYCYVLQCLGATEYSAVNYTTIPRQSAPLIPRQSAPLKCII